jgi:DNA-binding MarR family transcriptional regulator
MSTQFGQSKSVDLEKLSGEVSRLAGTLARLSAEALPTAPSTARDQHGQLGQVQTVIKARRLRSRHFPAAEIFADPAWDMLLILYHAELLQNRITVSSLAGSAAVPPTTAMRWIGCMVKQGLFVKRPDRFDARRIYVELTEQASAGMRAYFQDLQLLVDPVA